MRLLNLFVIIQAVLIFLFVIIAMFQWAYDSKQTDIFENSSAMTGFLPTNNSSLDMSRFSKGAIILLIVSVIEILVISKTFK